MNEESEAQKLDSLECSTISDGFRKFKWSETQKNI